MSSLAPSGRAQVISLPVEKIRLEKRFELPKLIS